MSTIVFPNLVLIILIICGFAAAQNLTARIEATVVDTKGAAISDASVTATNLDTGDSRSGTTDEDGTVRFPTISPGQYLMTVETPGFKRFERRGIALSAGETAAITLTLEPGRPDETVTITSDAAIADTTKFAVGQQLNSRDINNLPLVSRNPYNFVLLQPGVSGRVVSNPSVIDASASGLRRRMAYQLDGTNDNDANLSGFRLNLISEVYVKEMQLLSTGYPAEFGNTAGAVVNVLTPSGSNDLNGSVNLIVRPSGLASKPFGFRPGNESNVNAYGGTATLGGPILKNRWQFYAGYEWTRRNSITPIGITESDRQALISAGVSPSIFINEQPTSDTLPYFILRTDAMISHDTRINLRYNTFVAHLRHSGPGKLLTTERSLGLSGYDYDLAAQAVTLFSADLFSEFRFQVARRLSRTIGDELTGQGPTVTIEGVAGFGPDPNVGTVGINEVSAQIQEAVTRIIGSHSFKLGGGINFISDHPTAQLASQYTFPTLGAYIQAANGTNRRSYTRYQESVGDNKISNSTIFYNLFFQDEWSVSRRLRLSMGLRYELFQPPSADVGSPLEISRHFRTDWNNFAPRAALTYLLRDGKYRTVMRLGGGVHFDPPLLSMYRRALLNNGDPRYLTFTLSPAQIADGAPEFPNRVNTIPPPRDVDTVDSDFKTMYAVRFGFQIEQALSDDMSVTVGYVESVARHIPVYRNINCLGTGGHLADGRPVYGNVSISNGNVQILPCTNRLFPQFQLIKAAESVGNQNYRSAFVQWMKRLSGGVQLNANYTFSRSRDDAPEENGPAALALSDPSNRALDRSASRSDVRSVINMSIVARPAYKTGNPLLKMILSNDQVSAMLFANSGEPFNITTGDINRDGVTGTAGPDRPVGISRNSGRLPPYFGLDVRYSRFFKLSEKRELEFYIEATNVFNIKQVSGYDRTSLASNSLTSPVNPITGELRGPLPDPSMMSPSWRESRQVQLGAKVHF